MSEIKISVILPVYNVESFIDVTLTSLLNQTIIDDLEVIMIDDGSSDNSRYIIEKYALDYDNFYAYHKVNEGSGIARNWGFNLSHGEYIHFLDPDDYIPSDFYEKMYDLAVSNDVDFVVGNAYRFANFNIWENVLFKHSFKDLHAGNIIQVNLKEKPSLLWDSVIWNKLYKREFLKKHDIRFPNENIFSQDVIFSIKAYTFAEKIIMNPDIYYFWRVRKDKSSATQQRKDIKSFLNRLRVLFLSQEFIKNKLDDDLKNKLYFRWLSHDLILFLKKSSFYPREAFNNILCEIKKIIDFIPIEVFSQLNSYKRILYEMIFNDDIDSLLSFSLMEAELMEAPHIPQSIDKKYHKFINFKRDCMDEELTIEILDYDYDNENIFIKFNPKIKYFYKEHPHEIKAFLADKNNQYPLRILELKNILVLPVNMIKDNTDYQINFNFKTDFTEKENFLKSRNRDSINFEGFNIDLCIGINRKFIIKRYKTNQNSIKIDNIELEDNILKFNGKITEKIDNITIENIATFKKYEYPVKYLKLDDDSSYNYEINFTIPYKDITSSVIRKWEIKSDSQFKNITINQRQVFYFKYHKIIFKNSRNKVLIADDLYNPEDNLQSLKNKYNKLKKQNNKLNKQYNKLSEENKKLTNNLNEYKSRKIVKVSKFLNR